DDPDRARVAGVRAQRRVVARADQEVGDILAPAYCLVAIEQRRDPALEQAADAAARPHRTANGVQRQVEDAEIRERTELADAIDGGTPLADIRHLDPSDVDVDPQMLAGPRLVQPLEGQHANLLLRDGAQHNLASPHTRRDDGARFAGDVATRQNEGGVSV